MQYKEEQYIKYQVEGHFNTRLAYKKMDDKLGKKTIAEAFKSKFGITEEEYKELTIKHNDIPKLKKIYNNKRSKYYSDDKNKNRWFFNFEEFYNWYKKHTKNGEKCCYCGVDQEDAVNSEIYERSARYEKRGKSIEIERVVTFPEEKNI
jgi:predicted ATPase